MQDALKIKESMCALLEIDSTRSGQKNSKVDKLALVKKSEYRICVQ